MHAQDHLLLRPAHQPPCYQRRQCIAYMTCRRVTICCRVYKACSPISAKGIVRGQCVLQDAGQAHKHIFLPAAPVMRMRRGLKGAKPLRLCGTVVPFDVRYKALHTAPTAAQQKYLMIARASIHLRQSTTLCPSPARRRCQDPK